MIPLKLVNFNHMKKLLFILLLFPLYGNHTLAQTKFNNQVITTDGQIYRGNIQSYLSRKIIFYQNPEGLQDNSIGIERITIITGTMPESRKRRILNHNPKVIFISQPLEADRIETMTLNINNIETIQKRRNSSAINQVLIGAIAGCAAGGLITLLRGEPSTTTLSNWTPRMPDAAIVISLGLAGAGAGACIGSLRVIIPINGSINNYYKHKNELRKHVSPKNKD